MNDSFTPLIEGLCRIHRLNPRPVLEGSTIVVEDVELYLRHHPHGRSPSLILYCDYGPAPAQHEAAVHRMLLQSNMKGYTGEDETWCLTPEGHVVLASSFVLELLTPPLLAAHIALAAARAREWPQECLKMFGADAAAEAGVS
jgi:hypothetical protein